MSSRYRIFHFVVPPNELLGGNHRIAHCLTLTAMFVSQKEINANYKIENDGSSTVLPDRNELQGNVKPTQPFWFHFHLSRSDMLTRKNKIDGVI